MELKDMLYLRLYSNANKFQVNPQWNWKINLGNAESELKKLG